MSESERRRRFRYDRVLIESERILDPQLSDAVVYLTGAQVELLRNMTQYLRRIETYVDEYHLGYYLTPDVEDYDDLLEIVADLEETLMGNPNTLWGYKDVWMESESNVAGGAGDVWVQLANVPEGQIYVLQETYVHHDAGVPKNTVCYVFSKGKYFWFTEVPALASAMKERWQGRIVLEEGDHVAAWVTAPGVGKTVYFAVSGYKMQVP